MLAAGRDRGSPIVPKGVGGTPPRAPRRRPWGAAKRRGAEREKDYNALVSQQV